MITMRDIAVRAGVSRSTVSFVLNKKHHSVGISEDTRRRVLRAAEEMGFRRNELARAVVTGKNPVFCFLVPSPEVEVAARLLAGALEEAEIRRYSVHVIRLSGIDDQAILERCVELRPSGVMGIYLGQETLDRLYEEMGRYRIPIAVLDSSLPQSHGSRILSDDIDGCHKAIDHLVSLGHRRIAYIGGNPITGASLQREAGFHQAMHAHGLAVPEGYIRHGYWEPSHMEQATRQLFSGEVVAPTALFCADDKTAMVACRTLRRMGYSVPEDVSVIGFADLAMALFNDPPLTTIAQPFHAMGRAAVVRLLAAAQEGESEENDSDPPWEELLPTQFIVRESTAPVKTPPG